MRNFFVLFLVFLLVSCSSTKDKEPVTSDGSASGLYQEAIDKLFKKKEYKKAAELFEDVEREYPFSEWATRAQLMAAYAYYENKSYEDAITNLTSFLQLHPKHRYAPYAQYLIGMCYYVQISGVNRDQAMTYAAYKAFSLLIQAFPGTVYAKDAKVKLDLTKEYLAGQDMEVGRYYLRSKIPTAALVRFKNVVTEFQQSSHVMEALHRLVEIYLQLDMKDEALKSAAVLGHNYPGSEWYEETYALLLKNNLAASLDAQK